MTARIATLTLAAALLPAASAQARIAFDKAPSSAHPHVFVAADDGSHQRRLATGLFPRISPNGRWVAYFKPNFHTGGQQVRVVRASGGKSRLVGSAFNVGDLHWAPDSRFLGAQLGRGLTVYDVRSGNSRRIKLKRLSGFSFSPSSKSIVYGQRTRNNLNARSDLFAISRRGRNRRQLTHNHKSLNPLWTKQGIVYDQQTIRHNDAPAYDLFFVRFDGSGGRRVTTTNVPPLASGLVPHSASADGTHVLAEFSEQDEVESYAVDMASGAARKLGTFLLPAGISRDGATILAATNGPDPGAHHDIIAVPFAGGPLRLVLKGGADPDWTG
jgi:Tol biopolymer transport system component